MDSRNNSSNEELLSILNGKNSLVDIGQSPKESKARCISDVGVGDIHVEHAECEGDVSVYVNTVTGDPKDYAGDEQDA